MLILLLPQVLVTIFLVNTYYIKVSTFNLSLKSVKKKSPLKSKKLPSPIPKNVSYSTFYTQNLQFIQNFVGIYSDSYDSIRLTEKLWYWEDPALTFQMLQGIWGSVFLIFLWTLFIPVNFLFLILGLTLFLFNSAFGKAFLEVGPPILNLISNQVLLFIQSWHWKGMNQIKSWKNDGMVWLKITGVQEERG